MAEKIEKGVQFGQPLECSGLIIPKGPGWS